MSFNVADFSDIITCKQIQKIVDICKTIESIKKYSQELMKKTSIFQSKKVNKYKKDIFYNIQDKVYLSSKNIIINQWFKKLDYKIISSFEVIE